MPTSTSTSQNESNKSLKSPAEVRLLLHTVLGSLVAASKKQGERSNPSTQVRPRTTLPRRTPGRAQAEAKDTSFNPNELEEEEKKPEVKVTELSNRPEKKSCP